MSSRACTTVPRTLCAGHSTMMEPCVVWEIPSPPIGPRLPWRHHWSAVMSSLKISEQNPLVFYLCKWDSVTIATGISRFGCHISLYRWKLHTSDNFLDIHNGGTNPFTPSNRCEICSPNFFFMWVLHLVVQCICSSTIVKSSCKHSDVLS